MMSVEAANQILEQSTPPDLQADDKIQSGQEGSTEANLEATTPEKPETLEKVSSRMEVLIRREQAALQAEKAAKQREAELEEKLKRISEYEALKENPSEALKSLGLTDDDYVKMRLNDGEVPPEVKLRKVEERFDNYLKEQELNKEREQKEQMQRAQKAEEEATANFKSEINTYLKDNNARYELTLFEGQEDLIFEVIDAHYNRTIDPKTGLGKIMKINEAADKVEECLEKKNVERKKLSKTQALWAAVPEKQKQELAKQHQATGQKSKTLTNNLNASSSTPRTTPITDQERVRRAVAYAQSLRK